MEAFPWSRISGACERVLMGSCRIGIHGGAELDYQSRAVIAADSLTGADPCRLLAAHVTCILIHLDFVHRSDPAGAQSGSSPSLSGSYNTYVLMPSSDLAVCEEP